MTNILLVVAVLVSFSLVAQSNETVYQQSSEFSFYTVKRDTLFLDKDNVVTEHIIKIWECDTNIKERKPTIVLLSANEFTNFIDKHSERFICLIE